MALISILIDGLTGYASVHMHPPYINAVHIIYFLRLIIRMYCDISKDKNLFKCNDEDIQ